VLKFLENDHFDLLKVISKRVESMADKFAKSEPKPFPNDIEMVGPVIIYVGCHLSQCGRYDVVKVGS
jgi:hypothetical protein